MLKLYLYINLINILSIPSQNDQTILTLRLYIQSTTKDAQQNVTVVSTIRLIDQDDTEVYQLKDFNQLVQYIDTPGFLEINLSEYFIGFGSNYTTQIFEQCPEQSFLKQETQRSVGSYIKQVNEVGVIDFTNLPDFKGNVVFHYRFFNKLSSSITLFVQNDTNHLYKYECGEQCLRQNFTYQDNLDGNIEQFEVFYNGTNNLLYGYTTSAQKYKFAIADYLTDFVIYSRVFNETEIISDVQNYNDMALIALPKSVVVMSFDPSKQYVIDESVLSIDSINKISAAASINAVFLQTGNSKTGYVLQVVDMQNATKPQLIKSINYDFDFGFTFGGDYQSYILLVLNENYVEEYRFAQQSVDSIFKHRSYAIKNVKLDFNTFVFSQKYQYLYVMTKQTNQIVVYDTNTLMNDLVKVLFSVDPDVTALNIYDYTDQADHVLLSYGASYYKQFDVYDHASLVVYASSIPQCPSTFVKLTVNNEFSDANFVHFFELKFQESKKYIKVSSSFEQSQLDANFSSVFGQNNFQQINTANWFDGNVVDYQAESDNIELIQHLSNYSNVMPAQMNDMITFSNKTFAQGKNQIFVFENENYNLTQVVDLGITSNTIECKKIAINQDTQENNAGLFSVSVCSETLSQDVTQNWLYVVSWTSVSPFVVDVIPIDATCVKQISIQNNLLFVLDSFLQGSSSTGVFVHRFNFDQLNDNLPLLQPLYVVNQEDFALSSMKIESFEVLKTSDTNKRFRLALLDESYGLRGMDFNILDFSGRFTYSFDFNYIVANDGAAKGVKFQQLINMDTRNNDNNDEYYMMLISKNYNHYEMVLNFTNTNNYTLTTLQSPLLIKTYQRYGDGEYLTGQNVVSVSGDNGYLVVSYVLKDLSDSSLEEQILLAYDRNAVQNNRVYSLGGIYVNSNQNSLFAFGRFQVDSKVIDRILVNNQQGTLTVMTLNKNLQVRRSTGFNGNQVTIMAKNGFSSQSIKATNSYNDTKESKWWILFLVLGLGLVSLLIYIMYQRSKGYGSNNLNDPLLDQRVVNQSY